METNSARYYEFGEFRLDSRRRILLKNNQQVALSARIFDLLLVMVQNEGRILEHDELLDKVWEGMFVEQSNLKKSVSALRQILGEHANESLYIKTVPRRGYSFVSNVRALPDEIETAAIYRETETEVVVEEIIEDETELAQASPPALPAAESKGFVFWLKSHRIWLAAVGLLLFTAGFFAVKSFRTKPAFNYSVENVRAKRLTSEGNLGNTAPISPDGNYIVYPVYSGEQGSLWLRQVQTGSVARLTPPMPAQFWAYEFSPDGNYVYYILNHAESAQSGLFRIPTPLGGAPQKLIDKANGGLTFAPDSSRFAFTRIAEDHSSNEIVSAKPDGSDVQRAFVVPENKFLWSVKWSPDSVHLLCAMRERVENKSYGYVAEIPWNGDSGKAAENIVFPKQENQTIISANWMPDKTTLFLSLREPNADICQLWQYNPAIGEKRRVTNDDNSYRNVSLTRDGKSFSTVQESWKSEAWLAETQSLEFRPLVNAKNFGNTLWTKDDKLIYETSENQQAAIWLTDAEGTAKQPLTQGSDGIYLFPSLSQNGDFITYTSNRSGSTQIWRVNLDGTNPQQLTNSQTTVGLRSKLLSDGQTLLYTANSYQTGWNLYKQTMDGTVTPLTKTDTGLWSVAPDEKSIAVMLEDEKTKKYRTYIQSLGSGEVLKIFDFNAIRQLSWTRDGKALVYIVPKQDANELVLQPLDETPARVLSSIRGERISGFDWSFDGSKLIVVRSKYLADAFIIKAQENF